MDTKSLLLLPWQQKHPFKQKSSSDTHGFWYGHWWPRMARCHVSLVAANDGVRSCLSSLLRFKQPECSHVWEQTAGGYFEFSKVDPFHLGCFLRQTRARWRFSAVLLAVRFQYVLIIYVYNYQAINTRRKRSQRSHLDISKAEGLPWMSFGKFDRRIFNYINLFLSISL